MKKYGVYFLALIMVFGVLWHTATHAQQTAVKALCDAYAITQNWELTNIYSA